MLTAIGYFEDGGDTGDTVIGADEHGRFHAGFPPGTRCPDRTKWPRLVHVTLNAIANGSDGGTRIELDKARLPTGGEQVVVRLPRAGVTHFLVLNEHGAPLAAARVDGYRATVTGADGRGTFASQREGVLVGARGYQVVVAEPRAPAAGTPEDPLVFVLQRANRLLLRLRAPDGAVPAVDLVELVELRSAEDLFAGKRIQREFDLEFGGYRASCTRKWGADQPSVSTATVMPCPRGEILLHSLEPGQRCTVVVCDSVRSGLLVREIVTPDRGETLELDLVVTGTLRRIRGRVLTADGVPLLLATVVLFSESGLEMQTTTDAAGGFAFERVRDKGPLRMVAAHYSGIMPRSSVATCFHRATARRSCSACRSGARSPYASSTRRASAFPLFPSWKSWRVPSPSNGSCPASGRGPAKPGTANCRRAW
jgi:hypothetical protein